MKAVAAWELFAFTSNRAAALVCIPRGRRSASLLGAASLVDAPSTRRKRDRDFLALGHLLRLSGQPSDARAAVFHVPGVAAGGRARKVEPLGRLCLAALLYRYVNCGERRRTLRAISRSLDIPARAFGFIQLVKRLEAAFEGLKMLKC